MNCPKIYLLQVSCNVMFDLKLYTLLNEPFFVVVVPTDQLTTARDAFRVILRQILKKLSEAGVSLDDNSTTAAPNVSVKQV